jgi:hypothetical protein
MLIMPVHPFIRRGFIHFFTRNINCTSRAWLTDTTHIPLFASHALAFSLSLYRIRLETANLRPSGARFELLRKQFAVSSLLY